MRPLQTIKAIAALSALVGPASGPVRYYPSDLDTRLGPLLPKDKPKTPTPEDRARISAAQAKRDRRELNRNASKIASCTR